MLVCGVNEGEIYCEACADDMGLETQIPGEMDIIFHCDNDSDCLDAIEICPQSTRLIGAETHKIGALCTEVLTTDGVNWLKNLLKEANDKGGTTEYQRRLHCFWRETFADQMGFDNDEDE